ncbi:MAG: hypothetical protein WCG27_12555 [Pseudomonadota bacterium]
MLATILLVPSALAYKGEVVVVGVIKTSYASPETTDSVYLHVQSGGVLKMNQFLGKIDLEID